MKKRNIKTVFRFVACILLATVLFTTPAHAQTVKAKVWKKLDWKKDACTQGMCMDKRDNVYVSIIHKDKSVGIYKIDSHKKRSRVAYSKHAFGHANDMTYHPKTGYLYIVTGGDDGNTNQSYDILALDPKKKKKGEYPVVERYRLSDVAGWISGIAYDAERNVFYLKKADMIYVASLKKGKCQIKGKFPINYGVDTQKRYITQGISVYKGKIYLPLWDKKKYNSSIVRKYSVKKGGSGTYKAVYERTIRYYARGNKKLEMEGIEFTRSGKAIFNANCANRKGKKKTSVFVRR